MCVFSCVQLFATMWTVTRQSPLSMGFPRQEYWSGLSFPSLGYLPNQGPNLNPLHRQADSLPLNKQRNPQILYVPGQFWTGE